MLFPDNVWIEHLIKIGISLILGVIIGIEREMKSRTAGLRTIILITVGSCLFTIISVELTNGETDRIAANIITGIGFLGAGVVFKDENRVSGLTTAATIWAVSAIGMAVGGGFYIIAFITSALVLLILSLLQLDNLIDKFSQIRNYRIVMTFNTELLQEFEQVIKRHNLKSHSGKKHFKEGIFTGYWNIRGSRKNHHALISELLENKNFIEIEY
jgi:putative Mg2+ transporter-C (MgtC) family protein